MLATEWVIDRLKMAASDITDPERKTRNRDRSRSRREEAKRRLEVLELELLDYSSAYEDTTDEEIEELSSDNSWWDLHNELLVLCQRYQLAGHLCARELADEDWDPAESAEIMRAEMIEARASQKDREREERRLKAREKRQKEKPDSTQKIRITKPGHIGVYWTK